MTLSIDQQMLESTIRLQNLFYWFTERSMDMELKFDKLIQYIPNCKDYNMVEDANSKLWMDIKSGFVFTCKHYLECANSRGCTRSENCTVIKNK